MDKMIRNATAFFELYKNLFLWLQIVGIFAIYDAIPIWFGLEGFFYQGFAAFLLSIIPPIGGIAAYLAAMDAWNWSEFNSFIIFLGIHVLGFLGYLYFNIKSRFEY